MAKSLKNQPRPIIKEFVKEILKERIEIPNDKPIKFRDDKVKNIIRKKYKVPLDCLRFRKDNGRIASDVLTYEKDKGPIVESTDYGQTIIKRFLEKKDPDPTQELTNSILKDGQDEPAVVTTDGFLINGNRRKMVLEGLLAKNKGDSRFKYLEVVILPGLKEKEPPPTYEDIEQVENRYQFQRMGKAEYYNFDMALSVQRKLDMGFDLDEILLDDHNYQNLNPKVLRNKIQEFRDEYLEPLKCIDKYLDYLKRPGHYNTVSEGKGDSKGRWQAFLDYYKLVYKRITDEKQRMKLGIEEDEIGKIENVAFKIIRKRALQGVDKKAHQIMRDLLKLVGNPEAKKALFEITKTPFELPEEDMFDENGEPIDEQTKDKIWSGKYGDAIIYPVTKAYNIFNGKKESDTPIDLLTASLEKLNHTNMDINAIEFARIDEAMKLAKEIQSRGNELEHDLYDRKKNKIGSKIKAKK